jgi:hypothetical protein
MVKGLKKRLKEQIENCDVYNIKICISKQLRNNDISIIPKKKVIRFNKKLLTLLDIEEIKQIVQTALKNMDTKNDLYLKCEELRCKHGMV